MDDKLNQQIEKLFENSPNIRQIRELKEEIQANSHDKLRDLMAKGMDEDAAVRQILDELGDMGGVIANDAQSELDEQRELQRIMRNYRKRTVALIAAASLMYLAGFIMMILIKANGAMRVSATTGVLGFLLLFATATIILVFNFVNRPEIKTDKNLAVTDEDKNDYKEIAKKMKKMMGPLTSSMWLLTVIIFFFLSFATGKWSLTWLIFILASALQVVINMFVEYVVYGQTKRLFGYISGLMWLLIVIIYFLVSFLFHAWALSWLIFVAGALLQNVLRMVRVAREKSE